MFARTERLLLRPGFAEDAPALTAAIADEAIARNLARLPWPYAEADADAWLAMPVEPLRPNFLIMLRTGGAPRLVGGIGLHAAPSDDGDSEAPQAEATEIGYWIARPYWGLGFASEAGRAVVQLARAMHLPPLVSGHFVDNPASGAVLRKIGFRPTGRIVRRFSTGRGAHVDCALYAENRDAEDGPATGSRTRVKVEDMRPSIRLLAA